MWNLMGLILLVSSKRRPFSSSLWSCDSDPFCCSCSFCVFGCKIEARLKKKSHFIFYFSVLAILCRISIIWISVTSNLASMLSHSLKLKFHLDILKVESTYILLISLQCICLFVIIRSTIQSTLSCVSNGLWTIVD